MECVRSYGEGQCLFVWQTFSGIERGTQETALKER